MKKGVAWQITILFSLLLLGVGFFVFFKLLGAQMPLLFGSSDECRNSENGFSLLNSFVKGFKEDTYNEKETIFIKLQKECAVVGFGLKSGDVLTRPTKCIGKSCLCLCYLGDDNTLNGDDCKKYNFCEYYDTDFKSNFGWVELLGSDNIVKIEIDKIRNIIFVDHTLVPRIENIPKDGEVVGEAKEVSAEVLNRINLYSDIIRETSVKYGVDETLIKAVIAQESQGFYYAVSNAGAAGLMQLMPATANDLGIPENEVYDYANRDNENYDNNLISERGRILDNSLLNDEQKKISLIDLDARFDAARNIDAGTKYLKMQLDSFGDVQLALAAYNAGPGSVRNNCDLDVGFSSCTLKKETEDYVPSVLGYEEYLKNV